ncbi:MAG: citramalate synthase [Defluviitaleaceae bacterium]|nr:citramalate synthase [Defluviitaleaceae bacterium]MCL2263329.1 citramalate synthase [Defluviitaleaceae bacterium]
MPGKITIFDSTLRDGAQAEGISFSVTDKIKIAQALDGLGVDYIEAGNPGSNPKDLEFFRYFSGNGKALNHAKLIAFGSTRRKGIEAKDDSNVNALLESGAGAVCIFGKSWDFHVTDILHATLDENLEMIRDTVAYLKSQGKEVMFDAEHFFDGYKNNAEYAFESLRAAQDGGASALVLCDTNGGCFPNEIYEIVKKVVAEFVVPIGIHTHNDCEMAVANSIMAVEAGATQVQGTFTGFGERCGNANLSAIIPGLQLKRGYDCIFLNEMQNLTRTARFISEVANTSLNKRAAYVGQTAFAHKGGMHIDAVTKNPQSFEHINPEKVGNTRRNLMSEVSGRSTLLKKVQQVRPDLYRDSEEMAKIMEKLKEQEHKGYQFEGAESSFALKIRRVLGDYIPLFELCYFKIISEDMASASQNINATAVLKIYVDDESVVENDEAVEVIAAEEGNGPVNALDKALRKALEGFYHDRLKNVKLTDYKVRVLDSNDATESHVRVLIESTDGVRKWSTVGVSPNVVEASWEALMDSIKFKLIMDKDERYAVFAY